MPSYSRAELDALGDSSTADFIKRRVDEAMAVDDIVWFPFPLYSLHELQAALSVLDRLGTRESAVWAPGVELLRNAIDEAKHPYRCRSIFMYLSVLLRDRQPPPVGHLDVTAFLRNAHRLTENLGIGHGAHVGALRFPGFMSAAFAGLRDDEDPYWTNTRRFLLSVSQQIGATWASSGLASGFRCVLGVGFGYCDLDIRRAQPWEIARQAESYRIVAEAASDSANDAGHLGKAKKPFNTLALREGLNVFLIEPRGALRTTFQSYFSTVAVDETRCGSHRVFRLSSGSSYHTDGLRRVPILAVAFDIGNSSAASKTAPDTIAIYRAHLRREIEALGSYGAIGGVWSGDGMQLLFLLPDEDSERLRPIEQILDATMTLVSRQRAVRGELGSHYLRTGVAYRDELRSFARVVLSSTWDNPEVEMSESEALEEAERLQEDAKPFSDRGYGAGDVIHLSNSLVSTLGGRYPNVMVF